MDKLVVGPIIVLYDLAETNNAILNSTTLYSCPPLLHKYVFIFWQIQRKEKEIKIYWDLHVPSVHVQVPQPSYEMGLVFLLHSLETGAPELYPEHS